MTSPRERVLLVESDPEISDVIARQTLHPMGFQVSVVGAAGEAISEAVRFSPDVIIANLNLPGLSGKDLLVALNSQGVEVPVIVLSEKGMEGDVIQAFRLGASDYLRWPFREAEVISAVERVLKQVRSRRERESLARQLKQTNEELQRRVRELTTIFAIGKAVTSVTNHGDLMDKIVEGAVYVTEADSGWLLLREDRSKTFKLAACYNLPKTIAEKLNQPWEDGISSLVALSGESLSIHGEPLKRFKVARLGESALVVPVKVKKEVVGLLVVIRKAPKPFGGSNQSLLEAVADYASISLVNARLFRVLEERARSSQQEADNAQVSERIKNETLLSFCRQISLFLDGAMSQIALLLGEQRRGLSMEHSKSLNIAQENLKFLKDVAETTASMERNELSNMVTRVDLNDLVRQAISRYSRTANQGSVSLFTELPPGPMHVQVNPSQMISVLEGLVSNAIKFSPQGGQVTVRIEHKDISSRPYTHVSVKDNGDGFDKVHLPHLFESNYSVGGRTPLRFGGFGISLSLIKEIVEGHGGKVWAESEPRKGSRFHLAIPCAES